MRIIRQFGPAALGLMVLGLALGYGAYALGEETASETPVWSMNATAIEACSCPMFCQCYFNPGPAGHGGHGEQEHFCRFNMAYKVNSGNYGDVELEGAKFWIAGDLGSNFADGETDWAVVHFDPAVTAEQRQSIAGVLAHVFPVKWQSFSVGEDAAIDWQATTARAEARLGGGKLGEMILNHPPTAMSKEPMVLGNLTYWGAPRNDGFVLMPNEIEAYRSGEKPFEYSGGNGFMITIDIASSDVAAAGR
jgi:hypothetical protein